MVSRTSKNTKEICNHSHMGKSHFLKYQGNYLHIWIGTLLNKPGEPLNIPRQQFTHNHKTQTSTQYKANIPLVHNLYSETCDFTSFFVLIL